MTPPAPSHSVKPLPQNARSFFLDPDRRAAVAFAAGLVALVLAWMLSGANGIAGAYLAAAICLLALPVGALPVAIMIERADAWRPQPETVLLETLRWLLALLPVAGLLVVPILFLLPDLYPWARDSAPAGIWFTTPFLIARLAVYFAIWIGLVLVFARRVGVPFDKVGRMEDARAALGLGLHLAVGMLAAGDLVMALSAQFHTMLSSLLLMAAWSGLALSAAILVAPPDIGPARRRLDRLTPLAVLLAIWAFLHGMQFLIYASADRLDGAAWYGARGGSEGHALSAFAGFVVLLATLLTLKPGENRTRLVAALALLMHILEMFWFVTPSIRGSFKVSLSDVLVLIGVAGLAVGLSPIGRRLMPTAAHRPIHGGKTDA